jgi:O-antigen/teichoic acid export membrane protein
VPSGAIRGAGRFFWWNALRIAAALVWTGTLVVEATRGTTVHLSFIGPVYAIGLTGVAVVGIALFQRHCRSQPPEPLLHCQREASLVPLLRFGIPSAFAYAPLLVNARGDQIALALHADHQTVGYYVAATAYCWATVPLAQAIATLTATRVASHHAADQRVAELVRLTRLGVTIVGLSGVVAWLLAPIGIGLLNGNGFGAAVAISRVLLIGATVQNITYLLEEGARGLGQPRFAMAAELVGLAVMVLLLVLLARFGAIATATASTIGYLASFMVIVAALTRHTKSTWRMLLRPSFRLNAFRGAATEQPGS